MERALQGQLADEGAVGPVVAVVRLDVAQHRHRDDAVVVVAALGVEQAAEPLGRVGDVGGQRVVDLVGDLAVSSMKAVQACASTISGRASIASTQRCSSSGW